MSGDSKKKCPTFPFPSSCPSIYPRRSNLHLEQVLVTDTLSGLIQQTNATSVEYWSYIGLQSPPSVSITITNTGFNPMKVLVDINKCGELSSTIELFTLNEQGQSRSSTVSHLSSLRIVSTEKGICVGKYCLLVHYTTEC